jgi:hypothetical protein
VWHTPTLTPIATVAGADDFPWQTASTLASTPTGYLLVPEITGLWQITPENFGVSNFYPGNDLSLASEIIVSQGNRATYVLEPTSQLLRIFQ